MTKEIDRLPMIKPDKIEKIADIPVLFIRKVGDYVTTSESAWNAMRAFIDQQQLDKTKIRYFSAARDNPHVTGEENLRFDACIQTPEKVAELPEMGRQILKGGKMAVFTHAGPHEGIDETYDRILFKWFPESREKFDDNRVAFVEHFNLESLDKDPEKLITKLYIPIL